MKVRQIIKLSIVLLIFIVIKSYANNYFLPDSSNALVGQLQFVETSDQTDLYSLGRRYDIGYDELLSANPKKSYQFSKQTQYIVPTLYILPPGIRTGIVINLAEKRLYYYYGKENQVYIFPVGIGLQGWSTPIGETYIAGKIPNPTWYVPDSISQSLAEKGVYLPLSIPEGPDDPLGKFALLLAWHGYLIHGTNAPNSIGTRASSGCIRLFPEDIETLYKIVNNYTIVRVIDEPYKVGLNDDQIYLEVHTPLDRDVKNESPLTTIYKLIQQNLTAIPGNTQYDVRVDWSKIKKLVKRPTGVPEVVGKIHFYSNQAAYSQAPPSEITSQPR